MYTRFESKDICTTGGERLKKREKNRRRENRERERARKKRIEIRSI